MKPEILPVPPPAVADIWPQAEPFIREALERAHGCYLPEDIMRACQMGAMQLWIVARGDELLSAVVSEITQYPRKRVVAVPFIGGKELMEWQGQLFQEIEEWSKAFGCSAMSGGGRRGWARLTGAEESVVLWRDYDMPSREVH